jgi:DNA replication and repair protein RecF
VSVFKTWISDLELYNFRNHEKIKLNNLSEMPVVITGLNGIGKTNILEAISLLTPSKGLRAAKIAELNNQKNPDFIWSINAKLDSVYGPKEIITMRNIKPNAKTDSRSIFIDGQQIKKKQEIAQILNIIWVTPSMQQIFMAPSSERRNFYDQMVSNFFPEHVTYLTRYEKSMRERLKLLKDQVNDEYWLSALEQNMFNDASFISDARMKTLNLLNQAIKENDTAFLKADLSLSNEPIPGDYLFKLKQNRKLDAASGRTNLGPHLYDLEVLYLNKKMPARLCSTGEQKALLLNIILANAYALIQKYNIIPIMLFDEMISHLDAKNRELLFDEIYKINSQCWLTGIDPKSFAYIKDKANFIHLSSS